MQNKNIDNRIVVDLKKVQWARFMYRNQEGMFSNSCGTISTHGIPFSPFEYAQAHVDYPAETNVERARRLNVLDTWEPYLILQLSANHSVRYTGKKAIAINDAWNAYIFGKKTETKKGKK